MKYTIVTARQDDNDRRIDTVIRKILPSIPLTLVYKNIRTGFIRLNDKKTSIGTRIHTGDQIGIAEVLFKEPVINSLNHTADESLILNTLFKNEHLWIIGKPPGICVQKSKSNEESLDNILRRASVLPPSLSFSPGPLHRLDRNTSGILCFSQSLLGARWFTAQMKAGTIRKFYLGLAQGRLEQEEVWKDGIEKNGKTGNFYTVKIVSGESVTRAVPLSHGTYKGKAVTLIEYEIIGGKTHQIRAQTAHHGYSLLGDKAYGGFCDTSVNSIFLHAYKMMFPYNTLEIPFSIGCPLPQKFVNTLEICLLKVNTAFILGKV